MQISHMQIRHDLHNTLHVYEEEGEVRVGRFFWIALPYLLISCASVAQCGTSSSRCLLFPPPSCKITVGNLFGTQTSHRGERGGEITTGSRFEEK